MTTHSSDSERYRSNLSSDGLVETPSFRRNLPLELLGDRCSGHFSHFTKGREKRSGFGKQSSSGENRSSLNPSAHRKRHVRSLSRSPLASLDERRNFTNALGSSDQRFVSRVDMRKSTDTDSRTPKALRKASVTSMALDTLGKETPLVSLMVLSFAPRKYSSAGFLVHPRAGSTTSQGRQLFSANSILSLLPNLFFFSSLICSQVCPSFFQTNSLTPSSSSLAPLIQLWSLRKSTQTSIGSSVNHGWCLSWCLRV